MMTIQVLFTMAAAVCIWQSGNETWTALHTYVALGFMSGSAALQEIVEKESERAVCSGAISFLAVFVWPGFQTRNSVNWFRSSPQLAVTIIRLFHAGLTDFLCPTMLSSSPSSPLSSAPSLGRICHCMGPKTSVWFLGMLTQVLFTTAADV
ncbi:hypothetical protein NEOLEDRAFT_1238837 [Neolentinus lepideus HHB14362 ss-1]|uniref:Uncharacterized protein n=1 Tax=Neolentinus lepideus HHB14362 ss-1 TaxID=1314782 RepID=A0A165VAC2_9AGAM|nr:hypothetical protein NEOLEDRAFT_1238837 [Neolentinus lepideus HHB14362 ss-1]